MRHPYVSFVELLFFFIKQLLSDYNYYNFLKIVFGFQIIC
jgi:hypothetical protein